MHNQDLEEIAGLSVQCLYNKFSNKALIIENSLAYQPHMLTIKTGGPRSAMDYKMRSLNSCLC